MPRVYVACLACYNEGLHTGEWFDAALDDLTEGVAGIQKKCGHVDCDYAIHDHEDFCGLCIGEFDGLERVARLAELVEEHGEAFAKWFDNEGRNALDDGLGREFEDAYLGEFRSVEGYADDYLESTGMLDQIPENLRGYFDSAAFGRDLVLGGDIWTADADGGGVFVFSNH